MKLRFLAALLLPLAAFAQAPTAAPAVNLLKNGDFERFLLEDNLWDGVDNDGFLCGDVSFDSNPRKLGKPEPHGVFFKRGTDQYDAILEGGNIGQLAMPISVQVADFNGDGLLDIMTVDGAGYFRIYFNSGTATEPKFTQGELVPLYLGRLRSGEMPLGRPYGDALKLALGDFNKTGLQDLVLGNYSGDVMLIRNTGSRTVPAWRQPQDFDSIGVSTTRDGHLWANLLAPAVYDWNKDGKMDLLLGEGSYSANTIHLLLNPGTPNTTFGKKGIPSFNEDSHEYLAFGDGREQLCPAVVDYNGDGNPDLLVGDRTGNINVYLSQGAWKKGAELQRQPQPISFGGVTSIGIGAEGKRCVSVAVGDLNGDGLFDIIVGKPDGHIAISYNIGTAIEPKFGPLVDIKGEDVWKEGSIRAPLDWGVSFGYREGNFYGIFSVVNPKEDPEMADTNHKALKFSYEPTLNKIVRRFPLFLSGVEKNLTANVWLGFAPDGITPVYWGQYVELASAMTDSNIAIMRQSPALKPNTRYMLSFKVKGRNVREGHVTALLGGWLVRDLSATKNPPPGNSVCEFTRVDADFSVSTEWTTINKPIDFKFDKEPDLNRFEKWSKPGSKIEYRSILDIRVPVGIDDGVYYITDVQLTAL